MVAFQDLKRQQKRKCRIILHFRRADPMRVHYEEIDRKIASIRKQAERPQRVRRLKLILRAKEVTWKPVNW